MKRKIILRGLVLLLSLTLVVQAQDFGALSAYPGDGVAPDNAYNNFKNVVGQDSTSILTFITYKEVMGQNWVNNAGWSSPFLANSPAVQKLVPLVSVGLADDRGGDTLAMMNAVAAGTYDSMYQGIVNVYKNKGYTKIYLRIGWEQNGSWHPWYATNNQTRVDAFVAAWRRVADVAHAVPGITVRTVWCPNIMNWSAIYPTATYPGDQYVDVIAPDLYAKVWPQDLTNWWSGGGTAPNQATWAADTRNRQHFWDYPGATQWQPTGGFGLKAAIKFAMDHDKPFGLSESGTGGGADNGPTDGGDMPLYLANRLWYKVQRGLKIEFINIWDKNVSDGQWKFSSGLQPTNAASWVTFVNTMAGANVLQMETLAKTSNKPVTNHEDLGATGNYTPPIVPPLAPGQDPNSSTEDTNLVTDAQLGGFRTYLAATAAGDYAQFTVPVSVTGTYNVKVRIKTHTSRGSCQLAIDGVNQGPVQEHYSTVTEYIILDLGTKTFATTGNKLFKFTCTGKNASSTGFGLAFDYIDLTPSKMESEDMPYIAASDFVTVFDEAAASGGTGERLDADAVNDFILYQAPIMKAGTYSIKVRVKNGPNRGRFQLAIDGVNQGAVQDLYNSSYQYSIIDLGTKDFTYTGNKQFNFKVTGKNASSAGYALAFDYLELAGP